MRHEEALAKLTPQHRELMRKLITEPPRPLEPHEKAALDEFVEFLRKPDEKGCVDIFGPPCSDYLGDIY